MQLREQDAHNKHAVTTRRLELSWFVRTVPPQRLYANQFVKPIVDSSILVKDVYVLVVARKSCTEVELVNPNVIMRPRNVVLLLLKTNVLLSQSPRNLAGDLNAREPNVVVFLELEVTPVK